MTRRTVIPVCLLVTSLAACRGADDRSSPEAVAADLGTAADRLALFDTILARTLRRESFSEVKNERLGLDVEAAMRAERESFAQAGTDADLYYAMVRTSTARRDRHLSVSLVPGGLSPAWKDGLPVMDGTPETPEPREAPLRFAPDYGDAAEPFYFVSDWADALPEGMSISVGDRLVAINGRPAGEWEAEASAYMRASTVAGLRWKLAGILHQRTALLPPSFYGETLSVELETAQGGTYTLDLPYMEAGALGWGGRSDPRYPGFEEVWESPTFTLYRAIDRPVILLSWVGFREDMVTDVDRLLEWAEAEGALDHHVIFDATRSGGGSRGPYTIRRLTGKPFRTTFGNLRLSDAGVRWAEESRAAMGRLLDSGVRESDDDGQWLLDWLETDVAEAIAAGQDYTNDVPFKNAHAPKDSDGVLQPADVHFTGDLVVLLGPDGGSHLDQFAAIVADNDLGTILGMPAGGYSNTWEWYEVLEMPGTGRPLVEYMWSIGHTIRPNGDVLEGNPADVDEWLPLTRENAADYYPALVGRALEILGQP